MSPLLAPLLPRHVLPLDDDLLAFLASHVSLRWDLDPGTPIEFPILEWAKPGPIPGRRELRSRQQLPGSAGTRRGDDKSIPAGHDHHQPELVVLDPDILYPSTRCDILLTPCVPSVGVFATLTNSYCLVALGASENFYRCVSVPIRAKVGSMEMICVGREGTSSVAFCRRPPPHDKARSM